MSVSSELGFTDLEIVTWGGYFVPVRTPIEVVDRLNAALVRALNETEVQMKFKNWGLEPAPTSARAFAAHTRSVGKPRTWGRT